MGRPGSRLRPEHDIVRYAAPRLIDGGTITGAAFRLRAGEEGLSVNDIGCDAARQGARLAEVRRRFRLQLKQAGRFGQLEVGKVEDCLRGVGGLAPLSVIADPLPADGGFAEDPSHALVTGLPPHRADLAALAGDMLAQAIDRTHPGLEPGEPTA
jgi:hypothetical protein